MWILVVGSPQLVERHEGGLQVLRELGCRVRAADLWEPLENDEVLGKDPPAAVLVEVLDQIEAGRAALARLRAAPPLAEVPILAAARAQRQLGHGSVLVAILKELGVRMRLRLLVVSATEESQRFWLRQGLHTPAHCEGAIRVALRKLDQSERRGFANSIKMAMELPTSRGSGHVDKVLKRISRRAARSSRALTPAEAPGVLGYTDVNQMGNFVLEADGRKRPVLYGPTERLGVNVPYNKLEAFPVSATRG